MPQRAARATFESVRLAALLFVVAACGPKVHMADDYDLDVPETKASAQVAAPTYDQLPVAAAAAGARTGTISRTVLDATLDAGPGPLLQRFEVTAETDGDDRFEGWRVVAFDPQHRPFDGVDLAVGDVVVAINGMQIARPDQLEQLWEALRTAPAITADVRRAETRFQLAWTVTDGSVTGSGSGSGTGDGVGSGLGSGSGSGTGDGVGSGAR